MKRSLMHLSYLAKAHKNFTGQRWSGEMSNVWHALLKRFKKQEGVIEAPPLFEHESSWTRVHLACRLLAQRIDSIAKDKAQKWRAERRATLKASFEEGKGDRIFKLLKDPPPRRLTFLRDGDVLSSHPDTIDSIARKAWGAVYQGNVQETNLWFHSVQFLQRYAHLTEPADQAQLPPITAKQVREVFRKAPPSAPGPDAWRAQELAHMSSTAASLLSRMYMRIEEGCQWPAQVELARAIYLGKGPTDCAAT